MGIVYGWLKRFFSAVHWLMRRLRNHPLLIKRTAIGLAVCAAVSIVAQLGYPADRLLPGLEIEGNVLGGKTTSEVRSRLGGLYRSASVVLITQDKELKKSFSEIGLQLDADQTVRNAADYSIGERLIPFSALFIGAFRNTQSVVTFDGDSLKKFASEASEALTIAPTNATVVIANKKADLKPAIPGKSYTPNLIASKIRTANLKPVASVRLKPAITQASRGNDAVKPVLDQAKRALDMKLVLALSTNSHEVPREMLATWLTFAEGDDDSLAMGVNADAVTAYLQSLEDAATGEAGLRIDMDEALATIDQAVKQADSTTIKVPTVSLADIINELASAKGGYGIAVTELDGSKSSANGNKKFIAASTYKLFVAYGVFKQIAAGNMTWDDGISGSTVARCFDAMIVVSDNPCAKALGQRIGWSTIESMMHSLGLSSNTQLGASFYTTANDLALFMYKLEKGTLGISAADKSRLISAMKRQIYRDAIPAGTGVIVADKVGFVDGYLNDAAIVYGKQGTYIMVIMSYGSSWASMASAANQIHSFLQ